MHRRWKKWGGVLGGVAVPHLQEQPSAVIWDYSVVNNPVLLPAQQSRRQYTELQNI